MVPTQGQVERFAVSHTVFLYLDPFAIAGLEWASLDRLFRFVSKGTSIEILLNLNGFALGRNARQALGMEVEADTEALPDATIIEGSPMSLIDRVFGGPWWRKVVRGEDFPGDVEEPIAGLCDLFQERFAEVCRHDIKEAWHHRLPKYTMLFASRHPHAFKLMNDAAVQSRELWAEATAPSDPMLFETRPIEVVPDSLQAQPLILESSVDWVPRGDLILRVMRERFGLWSKTQIRQQITAMVEAGALVSETGKARMKDDVRVRRRH